MWWESLCDSTWEQRDSIGLWFLQVELLRDILVTICSVDLTGSSMVSTDSEHDLIIEGKV